MSTAAPNVPPRHAALTAGVAGLVLAAALFYFWILGQNHRSAYYLPFTDGYTRQLAAGHADLAEKPDARLLALSDPYDPRQNHDCGALFDASFYRGRYYVYFGITPFGTLLVPWYLLTGRVIPVDTATGIYAVLALLSAAACLLYVRGRWHPQGGRGAVLLGTAVLGFGTPVLLLLRRPEVYELEIAAGTFHVLLALFLAARAAGSVRRRNTWIAAASLSLGLAAGARPNCVLLAPLFLAWSLVAFREPAGGRIRTFLAALVPLSAAGLALAWFNWIRFGSPLEFGFKYQLVSYDRIRVGFWSFRNLAYNAHKYLLGGARLSPYFPFFIGESPGPLPLPEGHEATDQVYGCLLFTPFLWILLALAWTRGRTAAGRFALLGLALAAGDLALFLVMGNGAYRYLADFVPPALLVAGLALIEAGEAVRLSRLWRPVLWAGVSALALASCAAAVLEQFSLYEIFRSASPAAFSSWSRAINTPVYWVQRAAGLKPKVPFMDVVFPGNRFGQVEPLLVCGAPAMQDFLYAYYVGPGHIQIGFESMGRGGPLSPSIALDYARMHQLIVTYGSMVPPDGHPLLRNLSREEVGDLRSTLVVTLDGVPVLESRAAFHDTKDLYHWGSSPDDAAFGRAFTGTIVRRGLTLLHVRPPALRNLPSRYGSYALEGRIPRLPAGTRLPLLSAGYHPSGTVVFVEQVDPGHARLGLARYGGTPILGDPVAVGASGLQRYILDLGVLYPPMVSPAWPPGWSSEVRAARKRAVRLSINGSVSLAAEVDTGDASPVSVVVGTNAVGISGIAPDFLGVLKGSGPSGLADGR